MSTSGQQTDIPYYNPSSIDFESLARRDPSFAVYLYSPQDKDDNATGPNNDDDDDDDDDDENNANHENGSPARPRPRLLNFHDPATVQQLTRTLLHLDFGGLVLPVLPDSRLCPPVPVRWNYVKWMQDLLDSTTATTTTTTATTATTTTTTTTATPNTFARPPVRGLDLGTGATAIYALLACATRDDWVVVGSEMDGFSAKCARENLKANGERLGGRARVLEVTGEALIPVEGLEGEFGEYERGGDGDGGSGNGGKGKNGGEGMEVDGEMGTKKRKREGHSPPLPSPPLLLDFVMTNPPFYDSVDDLRASVAAKAEPASAVCTGSENEMICPGGDVGFVSRLLEESLRLRGRVRWYSAMMGKLSSLQEIVARLKKAGVSNWAVGCLQAGRKTKRWSVAWSFLDHRPSNEVARMGELVHAVLPPATAQTIRVEGMEGGEVGTRVDEAVRELDVLWKWEKAQGRGVMLARQNVWSRAARRRKRFTEDEERMRTSDEDGESHDTVALAVEITCQDGLVEVRWLRGLDQVLFTSFCGMLKRMFTGHG